MTQLPDDSNDILSILLMDDVEDQPISLKPEKQSCEIAVFPGEKVDLVSETIKILEADEVPLRTAIEVDKETIKSSICTMVPAENEDVGFDIEHALIAYIDSFKEISGSITLGYKSLDRAIGGIRPAEILTILASTTVGKTWLAINILKHISNKYKDNIGYFDLDDPLDTIVERMLQLTLAKPRDEINRMRVNKKYDDLIKITEQFPKVKLFPGVKSIPEIEKTVERDKLCVIFIDYLSLVNVAGSNQYEKISMAMQRLKEIATRKKIIVIILHQLSRVSECGTIPVTLSMARDSGAVEEMSSFVIGAYRPELKNERKGEDAGSFKDIIILQLLKNKRGLPHEISCHFNKKSGEITEYEEYVMDKKLKDEEELIEEL